jgi:hypothetical protein
MAAYAIEHTYGSQVQDAAGDHIGVVHEFRLRTARNAWVDAGPADLHSPGAREQLIPSTYSRDRRAVAAYKAQAQS